MTLNLFKPRTIFTATWRVVACGTLIASGALAGEVSLPNTALLVREPNVEVDYASQMVDGIDQFLLDQTEQSQRKRPAFWHRDYSSREAYQQSIEPNRQRLKYLLGAADARVPFAGLELVATTNRPALIAKGPNFDVYAVRWPVFGEVHGEGLLLAPTNGAPLGNVVAIPDCNQTPEQLVGLAPGIDEASQFARRLAETGFQVVIPALISRTEKFSTVTNREWIYRGSYQLGRHLIGYEVQKLLACVDWFDRQEPRGKIGVIGWSEGGLLALYAGALDSRIDAVCVSGFFDNRNRLWQEPIDRNVFGLLEQFGDAELVTMITPRKLIIEASRAAERTSPPGGKGAPGTITTPQLASVRQEVDRARQLISPMWAELCELVVSGAEGTGPGGSLSALQSFVAALAADRAVKDTLGGLETLVPNCDAKARESRQIRELEQHNESLFLDCKAAREEFFWAKLNFDSLEKYESSIKPLREYFAKRVIGQFDVPLLPANPHTRLIEENDRWRRYEVRLDVFPNVIAYGLLTLPNNIAPGERRPVVVCQHGLEGRPQDTIGDLKREYYAGFATDLAERGLITFAPQNPYIFFDRFRALQRKSNPLGKTLFSTIVPQHQQIVHWLQTLPQVDRDKIGFYGLSYGGKSAMRVPALVPDYCLSICSGDFNEWIEKTNSVRYPNNYLLTGEYEIFEFDLANTFNYAEMAALIAPRPFMVERGYFDACGTDEAVAGEYARVRRLYTVGLRMPERTEIEWFVGGHAINGKGTYAFLQKHLIEAPTPQDK